MARNRGLHRSGSSGLRSPILKWRRNLRVLPRARVKALRQLALDRDTTALALSALHAGETGVDMLFKSKAPEKDKNAAANAAEVMGRNAAAATLGR
jgi:hypothetical protein